MSTVKFKEKFICWLGDDHLYILSRNCLCGFIVNTLDAHSLFSWISLCHIGCTHSCISLHRVQDTCDHNSVLCHKAHYMEVYHIPLHIPGHIDNAYNATYMAHGIWCRLLHVCKDMFCDHKNQRDQHRAELLNSHSFYFKSTHRMHPWWVTVSTFSTAAMTTAGFFFHFTWAWFNSEITAYFIHVLTWKESWYFLVTRKATLLPLLSLKTFILYHVSTRQFLFNTCSTDFCTRLATKFFRTFCVQTTSLTFNFSGMPTNQCDRYFLDTAFAAHFQATTT